MSLTLLPTPGCRPIAAFDDTRLIERGAKVVSYNVTGTVRHIKTGKIFGAVVDRIKTDNEIRKSLSSLFAFTIFPLPLLIPARMIARIITLLTGDFFRAGVKFGTEEFLLAKAKNPTLSNHRHRLLIAKHVTWQLVKNIVKIATMPIALVGLGFASFYGAVINPHDGRLMFSTIEELWSRDIIEICSNKHLRWLIIVTDFAGRCMLPKQTWDEKNLYRSFDDYHKDTIRAKFQTILARLKVNREFYRLSGVPVDEILQHLDRFRNDIRSVSTDDRSEIVKLNLSQSVAQANIARTLADILRLLRNIERKTLGIKTFQHQPVGERDNKELTNQPFKQKMFELQTNWIIGAQDRAQKKLKDDMDITKIVLQEKIDEIRNTNLRSKLSAELNSLEIKLEHAQAATGVVKLHNKKISIIESRLMVKKLTGQFTLLSTILKNYTHPQCETDFLEGLARLKEILAELQTPIVIKQEDAEKLAKAILS